MIDQVCALIHNWFCEDADVRAGDYTVEDGALDVDFLLPGQYFRVVGSVFNDGVWKYPAEDMADETFTGEIWPMRLPRDFVALCAEIETWQGKYGAAMLSPYTNESVIGVYSYTKAATGTGGAYSATAWADAFKVKLNRWRKLR